MSTKLPDQCQARLHGRRCRRLAVGKSYESSLSASKPGWSLVTPHRFCARCGGIFLSLTGYLRDLVARAQ